VEKFWFDNLKYGLKGTAYGGEEAITEGENRGVVTVELDNLYHSYLYDCKDMSLRHPEDKSQFSKKLGQLCPGMERPRKSVYGKKVTYLKFPPLIDCRRSFEKNVKMEVDWGDDSDDGWTGRQGSGQEGADLTY
jgi:hypothetical protein